MYFRNLHRLVKPHFIDRHDDILVFLHSYNINFIVMSDYPLSPLRQIKLFFPPIDSPSLTTYLRSIRPKLNPLKQKYCVFSQMKEKSVCDNPETVYMSSSDIDIVASSYKKIKRSRG